MTTIEPELQLQPEIDKLEHVSKWINKFPIPTTGATAMMILLREVQDALSAIAADRNRREVDPAAHVECRECRSCGHVGINDSHAEMAACHACDWHGDSQKDDVCPGCASTNVMGAACPKCGGLYELIAETEMRSAAPVSAGLSDKEIETLAITLWNSIADKWNDWTALGQDEKEKVVSAVRALSSRLLPPDWVAVPTTNKMCREFAIANIRDVAASLLQHDPSVGIFADEEQHRYLNAVADMLEAAAPMPKQEG